MLQDELYFLGVGFFRSWFFLGVKEVKGVKTIVSRTVTCHLSTK